MTKTISDNDDVNTTSPGHIPEDGQVLTWNEGMGHWMPKTITMETPSRRFVDVIETLKSAVKYLEQHEEETHD